MGNIRPPLIFQSTPSRRGRLDDCLRPDEGYYISIHSLTQRETNELMQLTYTQSISIHSLTQRETTTAQTSDQKLLQFQSTPSRRGRRDMLDYLTHENDISIHSLTQRETSASIRKKSNHRRFQSTPSRRGRLKYNYGGIIK